jgi:HK97 gp10 family phage protein
MSSKGITIGQFEAEIYQIVSELEAACFEARQEAVQAGAEFIKAELVAETPIDTGDMARSWEIKTQYKNHRYVGNTKTVKVHRKKKKGGEKGELRDGVPLINVLEFAENSPHQGFMRRTFEQNKGKIYKVMKTRLEQTLQNKLNNGG